MNYLERIYLSAIPPEGILRHVRGCYMMIIAASHSGLWLVCEFDDDKAMIPLQLYRGVRQRFHQLRIWDKTAGIDVTGHWIDLLISRDPIFDIKDIRGREKLTRSLAMTQYDLTAGVPTADIDCSGGEYILKDLDGVAWKWTDSLVGAVFMPQAVGEPLHLSGFAGTITISRDAADVSIIVSHFW